MSLGLRYLVIFGSYIALTLPWLVVMWRRAERDARKQIAKLTPPVGVSLGEAGTDWLVDRLVRRIRWSAIAIGVIGLVLAVVVVVFGDVPLVDETGPVAYAVAVGSGYMIGGTLATVTSARTGAGPRRSTTLIARTPGIYLRAWERRLETAHLVAAVCCVAVSVELLLSGAVSRAQGVTCLGLTLAWMLLLATLMLLERWILRAPPVVDEHLHIARELMVSIALRTLVDYQLLLAAIVAFVGTTYASLTTELPMSLNMVPLYGTGAIALAAYIARTNRDDGNAPAPEWHSARTLGRAS